MCPRVPKIQFARVVVHYRACQSPTEGYFPDRGPPTRVDTVCLQALPPNHGYKGKGQWPVTLSGETLMTQQLTVA